MNYAENTAPVLTMLHEAYSSEHQKEYDGIKAVFETRYESRNGMSIQVVDRVIYPLYTLCRELEWAD